MQYCNWWMHDIHCHGKCTQIISWSIHFFNLVFLANHLLCLFLKVEVASVLRFCFPMSLTCAFYGWQLIANSVRSLAGVIFWVSVSKKLIGQLDGRRGSEVRHARKPLSSSPFRFLLFAQMSQVQRADYFIYLFSEVRDKRKKIISLHELSDFANALITYKYKYILIT